MQWLLLMVAIVFASMNSIVIRKAQLVESSAIYRFNLLCSLVWCVCLFVANGCRIHLDGNIILFAVIYGAAQTLFILFKTAAMNSGPVAITTLIGNCALIINVLVCLIWWKEPISGPDVVGLGMLLLGIALSTYKKAEGDFTRKWKIYLAFFLIFAASVGIALKAFSKTGASAYAGDMMFAAAVVMLLLYSAVCLIAGGFGGGKQPADKKKTAAFIRYALIAGVFGCVYNRLNIYLSGVLDGVIFFPALNGGVVFLVTILSIVLLKEKLALKQGLGILLGIAGICVIGIL